MAMVLSTILQDVTYRIICGDTRVRINSIHNDSREVVPGGMFIAVLGTSLDGHKYITQAIEAGASCIAVDKRRDSYSDEELINISREHNDIAIIEFEDSRIGEAMVCSVFYGHPEDRLDLIGITGTKGKTTTSFMIYDILKEAHSRTGLMGTVYNIVDKEIEEATRTTDDAINLYKRLEKMVKSKLDSCVMEVSSHGLKQHRVHSLRFDVACFTNFYRDHIGPNDHPDMDDYFASKMMIFDSARIAIINDDCDRAEEVKAYAHPRCSLFTYGLTANSDCYATDISSVNINGISGSSFKLVSPWYEGEVLVSLAGDFNIYNALCAIAVAGVLKVDFDIVKKALSNTFVPGRVQPVPNKLGIDVIIDYAHNEASLESVLVSLRKSTQGRIITVFGCGGDRSSERRPSMGKVSGIHSDLTIVTSDNPRNEAPSCIIADIEKGLKSTDGEYLIDEDRESAIRRAINLAKTGDLVLIAGKGHENYQEFANKRRIDFDDFEVASKIIKNMEVSL